MYMQSRNREDEIARLILDTLAADIDQKRWRLLLQAATCHYRLLDITATAAGNTFMKRLKAGRLLVKTMARLRRRAREARKGNGKS
jgi:hypothetical protein